MTVSKQEIESLGFKPTNNKSKILSQFDYFKKAPIEKQLFNLDLNVAIRTEDDLISIFLAVGNDNTSFFSLPIAICLKNINKEEFKSILLKIDFDAMDKRLYRQNQKAKI